MMDKMIVNKMTAFRCACSLPDFVCPTSHEEFLLKFRTLFEERDRKELQDFVSKSRPNIESAAQNCGISGLDNILRRLALERHNNYHRKEQQAAAIAALSLPSDSSGSETAETAQLLRKSAPLAVHQLVKQKECLPKPWSYIFKRKFEDEKTPFTKLGSHQILVNDKILNVDHENYIREKDVEIPYDSHQFQVEGNILLKDTPPKDHKSTDASNKVQAQPCDLPHCNLGCVCNSTDSQVSEVKRHCGRATCMVECSCITSWNNQDEYVVDMRSRLRPRVTLLNWNIPLNPKEKKELLVMEATKDAISMNTVQYYRDRIKRKIVPPKRSNAYISHLALKKGRVEARILASQRRGSSSSRPSFKHVNKLGLKEQQKQLGLRSSENKNNLDGTASLRSTKRARSSKFPNIPLHRRTRPLSCSSVGAVRSGTQFSGAASFEGTGSLVPPDIMANFASLMEVQYQPESESRELPVSGADDSSGDSEFDDDDDDEDHLKLTYVMNPNPVNMQEQVRHPAIVPYGICNEEFSGWSNILHGNKESSDVLE